MEAQEEYETRMEARNKTNQNIFYKVLKNAKIPKKYLRRSIKTEQGEKLTESNEIMSR